MYSISAWPILVGDGRPGAGAWPWTAAWCLGAAKAWMAFWSMAAVLVGRVNRPWVWPWPSSTIRSDAAS